MSRPERRPGPIEALPLLVGRGTSGEIMVNFSCDEGDSWIDGRGGGGGGAFCGCGGSWTSSAGSSTARGFELHDWLGWWFDACVRGGLVDGPNPLSSSSASPAACASCLMWARWIFASLFAASTFISCTSGFAKYLRVLVLISASRLHSFIPNSPTPTSTFRR